ncbi:hypothetical protein D9M71_290000 [compost metagenome]
MRGQYLDGTGHQLAGHGHDLAAVFVVGDEQVRTDQAFAWMLPAHQYLDTGPAVVAMAYHGLEVGDEFVGLDGPLQFHPRRTGPAQLPVAGNCGHGAEHHQQTEQGWILAAHLFANLALGVTAVNREGIARRNILAGGHLGCWGKAFVDLTTAVYPVLPHLQDQLIVGAEQVEGPDQMIAIDCGDSAPFTFRHPVHQQWMPGGYRVAIHQPQFALNVVIDVDRLAVRPEQ